MPIPMEQMQMVSLQLATHIVTHRPGDFPVTNLSLIDKETQIAQMIHKMMVAIMNAVVGNPDAIPMPPIPGMIGQ